MIDYIELYTSNFNKFRLDGTERIKNQLIDYKNNYSSFYNAFNTILKENYVKGQDSFINKEEPYRGLYNLFQDRFRLFEAEHNLKIIELVILEKYNSLKISIDYTFDEFILELAKVEALKENNRLFHLYSTIYKLMYQVGVFDDFELVEYNMVEENVPLFKKYHALIYGVKSKSLSLLENNRQEEINFKIKSKFLKRFKESYYEFTGYYIDENKTSYDDFCKVFLNDIGTHKSEIHFHCDTKLASLLLNNLNEEIFDNLSQVNIAKSKLFKSQGGKPLSQSTLSRTKLNASHSDHDIVASTLQFLKQ
ncbi:hypothetical protein NO995_06950 [Aestuariibaculum sp. M13]|uniref:hypothetical protein n=1 Tax=Aestuariibaculum sp. M13 TaxID=2967132 RepID=UPI002159E926|nr:hypothetical protein [Aestuariibaculum sp. M13]MCR8667411.1 hypothetical protein [Aestuariibaculum sp. M13]